jgi:hypothetical protein
MTRLLVLAVLLALAPHVHADPYWRTSGSRGTVTAYELDGRTVIDRKYCSSRYRTRSVEYGSCSSRLRDEVKHRLCSRYGRGTHHFFLQIGDGRPHRSSVSCYRRH